MAQPLAEIIEVYDRPLNENSAITAEYNFNPETQDKIKQFRQDLSSVIETKRDELGLSKTRPLNLSKEDAARLRDAIRSDARWVDTYAKLTDMLSPEANQISLDERINAINIPWWNGCLLFREDDSYNAAESSLHLKMQMSHSYVTQLIRAKKLTDTKRDSASISNILITKDNLLILGWRGGHSYSDTLMTVPAGSLEYQSGKNPLFETLYAEHFEETGMTKDMFASTELIGKIFDHTLSEQTLYVFKSVTNLNFHEMLNLWRLSEDKREHKYLIAFPDDAAGMLEDVQCRGFNAEKMDPDARSSTTQANIGSILPPCAASILAYYAQKNGMGWAQKAESLLNDTYTFRSR